MALRSGIYMIRNKANGKRYIGSAVNIPWRETKHRLHLGRGTHHSRHLQRAWEKYGAEAFEFNVIETCSVSELIVREQAAFDKFRPEYNVCNVAGSCLGVKRDEAFKKKISLLKKGVPKPAEVRAKISASLRGRPAKPVTSETKALISRLAKARANGHGASHMQKLADARRGVPRTAEVRRKLSIANSRLSENDVRTIRQRHEDGEIYKSIASDYGILPSSVGDIIRGSTYRWVA